ncbi:hypothetical protein IWW48_001795 [Coemansia sp. RSA 1200]|nr:hypothetical protein IWW48_001795 [Coemansia sp. RSA 1200]
MGLGDELRKYIPQDFGKKKKKYNNNKWEERGEEESRAEAPAPGRESETEPAVGPEPETGAAERPAESTPGHADTSNNGRDDEASPPAGQHIMLRGHTKAVSALAWDPSGTVLVSGEHGAQVRIWGFSQLESIGSSNEYETQRTVEAWAGQQTHAAAFNRTGRVVACATGDPRAKLLTLDGGSSRGTVVGELARGDMYIRDLRRTTGHVAPLTSVDWHPLHDDVLLTAGADSTVRIWSCDRPRGGTQLHVVVPRARSAGGSGPSRAPVTACAYAPDGSAIAAAHGDGSLALWPARGPFLRPIASTSGSTAEAEAASCVAFSPDSRLLATRSSDRGGSVRVWDIRNAKTPVAAAHALPCAGAEASVAFSPSGRHLLAGVGRGGMLALLRADSLAVTRWIETPFASSGSGGVVRALWHPLVNQIAVASTAGDIAVMYDDPATAHAAAAGGALLCANKKPRRHRTTTSGEAVAPGPIIAPHALPLFRDDSVALSASSKRRTGTGSANLPRPPPAVAGHGRGGNIGVNETQHIMKSIIKDTMRDEDPREALLRFADVARDEPRFISPAYARSSTDSAGDDDTLPPMKRRK